MNQYDVVIGEQNLSFEFLTMEALTDRHFVNLIVEFLGDYEDDEKMKVTIYDGIRQYQIWFTMKHSAHVFQYNKRAETEEERINYCNMSNTTLKEVVFNG